MARIPRDRTPPLLFTDNETNFKRLDGVENENKFVKDAFHEYIVGGRKDAVNPKNQGTKAAAHYVLELKPGESQTIRLRLFSENESSFQARRRQHLTILSHCAFGRPMNFMTSIGTAKLTETERNVVRQGYAGLLWSKQFYHYIIEDWLKGDPHLPPPPESRQDRSQLQLDSPLQP